MKRLVTTILMTASLMIPAMQAKTMQAKTIQGKTTKPVTLEEAVRHELAMMPRYGVFDNLAFSVDGSTVTLTGQVAQPIVKSDAMDAARHVEGVTKVVNNIEVLPLSGTDDRIRMATYRAIYGAPSLSARYGQMASPPIRIIVKNGVVTLEGYVANQMDRNIAFIRASGVFGAFKVENDLKIG